MIKNTTILNIIDAESLMKHEEDILKIKETEKLLIIINDSLELLTVNVCKILCEGKFAKEFKEIPHITGVSDELSLAYMLGELKATTNSDIKFNVLSDNPLFAILNNSDKEKEKKPKQKKIRENTKNINKENNKTDTKIVNKINKTKSANKKEEIDTLINKITK